MSRYQLKVEFPMEQFLDDLGAAVEKSLAGAKLQVTPALRADLRSKLKGVLEKEMLYDATCGLSLACKEGVLVEPFSQEAAQLQREEAQLKAERRRRTR